MILCIMATGALSFILKAAGPGPRKEAFNGIPYKEVYLGKEIDQCSGSLTVKNKDNQWISIPRGHWKTVDVAIDGNGYWYWKCGTSIEKSRGVPNYRQRVIRLQIFHSQDNRAISWKCYDVL